MKRNNNKKGFTIVELVIVIGVIGILSAILIPTFANLTDNANKARAKEEVNNAYTQYVMKNADKSTGYLAQDKVAVKRGDLWYTYTSTGWGDGSTSRPANVGETEEPVDTFNSIGIYDNTPAA